jgi:integrase
MTATTRTAGHWLERGLRRCRPDVCRPRPDPGPPSIAGTVYRRCACRNRLTGRQWGAQCHMLEDPSHGSWYYWIKVTDAAGLRKRVRRGGFPSDEAAIAARDAALTEPSPRVLAQAWTVQKWLTDWLEQLDLRPSTVRGYAVIVRCHLIPALGSRRLSELEPRDVYRAMDRIAGTPTRHGVLAASTVTGVLSVLRSALGAARARGYIRFNPAFDVRKVKPARVTGVVWTPERIELWRTTGWRPPVAVWDPDGVAAFLDLAADDPLLPLWRLVTLCGLRRGEVAGLRGDDFDFPGGYVRVTRQIHVNGPRRWIGPPKSAAGTRIVPLDDVTNEACRRRWLQIAADPRRGTLNPDSAMFLLPDGRPVSPDYLTRRFARLVKLHGLPPIRLHDLRHEAASLMGAAGVEPHVIQQVLGHSSAVTTVDTYWQVFREIARAAVNASADLLRQHASRRRRLGAAILA